MSESLIANEGPLVPWNKGAFVGPTPPLKPKQVSSIRLNLQREHRIRDLALFNLAIDSKLRGSDLVQLRIGQLVMNSAARHRAMIVQQKTQKPVQFELTDQTWESLFAAHPSWRRSVGLCLSKSGRSGGPHQHSPVCQIGGRLGRRR